MGVGLLAEAGGWSGVGVGSGMGKWAVPPGAAGGDTARGRLQLLLAL